MSTYKGNSPCARLPLFLSYSNACIFGVAVTLEGKEALQLVLPREEFVFFFLQAAVDIDVIDVDMRFSNALSLSLTSLFPSRCPPTNALLCLSIVDTTSPLSRPLQDSSSGSVVKGPRALWHPSPRRRRRRRRCHLGRRRRCRSRVAP